MGPYEVTLIFLTELLRYLTELEKHATPEDLARREKFWAFWDKIAADFEKMKPGKD